MFNQSIHDAISIACGEYPRNFTEIEKQYILHDPVLRNELLAWFGTALSNGYWTKANIEFMKSLQLNSTQGNACGSSDDSRAQAQLKANQKNIRSLRDKIRLAAS
ncbi:MAG: hypothetical protein JOZ78_04055 [Chroococcidiopsidaceae cyanobacterium CP_BM_ER_R8_30]|nr:hypothetical protein [Chroococcidiopsidaceae cyanobacterium CP_BM_ER_R8_30]